MFCHSPARLFYTANMTTSQQEQDSVDLCPNCMGEVPPGDHFCKACMTPMDSFAATDPVRSIHAEFNIFNKASRNAPKPIVLIGMWLIWGPSVAAITIVLCYGAYSFLFTGTVTENFRSLGLGGVLGMLFFVAAMGFLLTVGVKYLYCTTRNYIHRSQVRDDEEDSVGDIGDEWKSESSEV